MYAVSGDGLVYASPSAHTVKVAKKSPSKDELEVTLPPYKLLNAHTYICAYISSNVNTILTYVRTYNLLNMEIFTVENTYTLKHIHTYIHTYRHK